MALPSYARNAKTPYEHHEVYLDLIGSSQGKGIPSSMMSAMKAHAQLVKALPAKEHSMLHKKISAHVNQLMRDDEISDDEASSVKAMYAPPTVKEGTEMELDEKKMTSSEMAKREKMVKSMKKGFAGFKKRYGERAKEVMYATATKQAMKEGYEEDLDLSDYSVDELIEFVLSEEYEQLDEISQKTIRSYLTKKYNRFNKATDNLSPKTRADLHKQVFNKAYPAIMRQNAYYGGKDRMPVHPQDLKGVLGAYYQKGKEAGDARRAATRAARAAKQAMKSEEVEQVEEALFKDIPHLALQHHPLQNGKPQLPAKINQKHIHLQHISGKVNSETAKYKVVANGAKSVGSEMKVGSPVSGSTANSMIDDAHALPGHKVVIHTDKPQKYYMDMEESVQDVGQHYCAKHVLSNVFGEGVVLEGQHAEPDENGHVEWYTVQFDHGEEVIFAEDVEIMVAEYHANHSPSKKKMKKKE